MFDWLFGRRRRDEESAIDLKRASAEGDRLHRLRQAIATVTARSLDGKDATENAAIAASVLTGAVVEQTIVGIEDDDDVFVAGIFAFVFSNYFALLLGGNFEMASSLAIMKGLGLADFNRRFGMIRNSYNGMVQSDPKVIDAIGKTTEAWFRNPSPAQFERLTKLFKMLRDHVVQK